MTPEKAIRKAIEFETKVLSVYRDALAESLDPVGQRIFSALADEEQGHVDYLNQKLIQLQKTGEIIPEKLETSVPSSEEINNEVETLKIKIKVQNIDGGIRLLEKALGVEIETSNFYEKMVSEMTGRTKDMFAQFLEIEQGHKEIVQAEIDALRGTGFWLGFQEFDMEL